MEINAGMTIPSVAANAPAVLLSLYPTKIAVFAAIIPGTLWLNA